MKIPTTLPTIDGATMAALARSGVIAEANAIRKNAARALSELNPAGVVLLAVSLAPDKPPAAAVEQFRAAAAEFLGALAAAGESSADAHRAEQQRLAGAVAAAAHRSLEILGAVANIDARVHHGVTSDSGKRDRLRAAGLQGGELDRAAAPFNPATLEAERAVLLAEHDALNRFLRSRDPAHMPEGLAGVAEAA